MTSTASRSEADDDRWFFGKISRDEAADHLNHAGGEEGTFLVRESSSSPGNFVLSFISNSEPVDILICNYWQDAFYYLLTDRQKIFHGLDTLVSHYGQHPVGGSSGTLLCQPCIGDPPPPETRLHGSSNLLHRAVSQANVKIVSELLKSGYRKLDAKNDVGQTALHVACVRGSEEVVRLLLGARANANVRDQEGMTPLQHACRQDFASIVHLLVKEGGANIQLRTPATGEVALHEAASCGSVSCVRALLSHHAPAFPRSACNRTPAAVARDNGHVQCYKAIVNHRPPIPLVRLPEYYQGKLSRGSSQSLLQGEESGSFLLRKSSKERGEGFALSVVGAPQGERERDRGAGGQVYHFHIQRKRGGMGPSSSSSSSSPSPSSSLSSSSPSSCLFFMDDGPLFSSLETLVDHYARFRDGLPARLASPVAPVDPLPDQEFHTIYRQDCVTMKSVWGEMEEDEPLFPSPPLPLPPSGGEEEEGDVGDGGKKSYSNGGGDTLTPLLSSKTSGDNLILPLQNLVCGDSPLPLLPPSPPPTSSLPRRRPAPLSPLSPPPPPRLSQVVGGTMKGDKTEEVFGVIDPSSLSVGGPPLGEGEFGTVLRGVWVSPSGDQIDVAVKTLRPHPPSSPSSPSSSSSSSSITRKRNFLLEAQVMMNLNHPYIVKLIGLCHGPVVAMVQELAPMGSLLNFLLDSPELIQPDFHFKLWAAQVAEGMSYLEGKHFVHRDLAARNLLLSSISLVKISDFGLSRALSANNDYYKATHGGRWPLKWYAPESIYYGQFTHLSDVWSYGVTLWEMHTYGQQPYGDLTGHEVAELLEKGERLPLPPACPTSTFNLMLRCWHATPKKRPTFRDLVVIFRGSKDYVNIKPYFKKT